MAQSELGDFVDLKQRYAQCRSSAHWQPPEGLCTHCGKPISPNANFFVAPPDEIGPLVSAYSSLEGDREPPTLLRRLAVVLGIPAAIVAVGWLAPTLLGLTTSPLVIIRFLSCVAAAMWLFVSIGATRFRHTCSYVGTNGFATFRIYRSWANLEAEVWPFSRFSGVKVSGANVYSLGITYSHSSYSYLWLDHTGHPVACLEGECPPQGPEAVCHAGNAEEAWTRLLIAQWPAMLARDGMIRFDGDEGQWIAVGDGFLEICPKHDAQPQRLRVDEIGKLELDQGFLAIHHKDARWFSGQGKFTIEYSHLINGRAFIIALDRILGISTLSRGLTR